VADDVVLLAHQLGLGVAGILDEEVVDRGDAAGEIGGGEDVAIGGRIRSLSLGTM
jgi:hypothetical protein